MYAIGAATKSAGSWCAQRKNSLVFLDLVRSSPRPDTSDEMASNDAKATPNKKKKKTGVIRFPSIRMLPLYRSTKMPCQIDLPGSPQSRRGFDLRSDVFSGVLVVTISIVEFLPLRMVDNTQGPLGVCSFDYTGSTIDDP